MLQERQVKVRSLNKTVQEDFVVEDMIWIMPSCRAQLICLES